MKSSRLGRFSSRFVALDLLDFLGVRYGYGGTVTGWGGGGSPGITSPFSSNLDIITGTWNISMKESRRNKRFFHPEVERRDRILRC